MNACRSKVRRILSILIVLFSLSVLAKERPSVVFVNPGVSTATHHTGGFWFNVASFMQAAADDLNIDLEVLYAERNHIALHRLVSEVSSRSNKPDYLLVVNEKLQGLKQLKIALAANIKTFMVLNTLSPDEVLRFGGPRDKHPNWIGSLVPDNYFAGKQIARAVIQAAQKLEINAGRKVEIIGLAGDFATPASLQRTQALEDAVLDHPNIELKQIFTARWSRRESKEITFRAFARYPNISAIWAANDPIALGAMEAAIESSKIPGKKVIIGGLNWDKPALDKIQDGSLLISMGGHFMVGGWAIVMLYDYHHGHDFGPENPQVKMRIFDKIEQKNVGKYLNHFSNKDWGKIDFSLFSKIKNPAIKEYSFTLKEIMTQLDND
ncbi:ABC transporter substrate-binding protein [Spartinivicinus poritis]|uniref:ABC transporter substrate-binding protein n=1 Tax=Spartinivicinus poritis TaxID=2994640 RepID=A0ABT5UCS1_9GAMM|nr:ABC transporter substrate-binding protein [Spartinivicinus sp. A2-2]MDE1464117.1 ABC transporter substrate-binding protein [Spartinivicinus sp. A2-2]